MRSVESRWHCIAMCGRGVQGSEGAEAGAVDDLAGLPLARLDSAVGISLGPSATFLGREGEWGGLGWGSR